MSNVYPGEIAEQKTVKELKAELESYQLKLKNIQGDTPKEKFTICEVKMVVEDLKRIVGERILDIEYIKGSKYFDYLTIDDIDMGLDFLNSLKDHEKAILGGLHDEWNREDSEQSRNEFFDLYLDLYERYQLLELKVA